MYPHLWEPLAEPDGRLSTQRRGAHPRSGSRRLCAQGQALGLSGPQFPRPRDGDASSVVKGRRPCRTCPSARAAGSRCLAAAALRPVAQGVGASGSEEAASAETTGGQGEKRALAPRGPLREPQGCVPAPPLTPVKTGLQATPERPTQVQDRAGEAVFPTRSQETLLLLWGPPGGSCGLE